MGEAPVILDTTLVTQSVDELKRFFINKGYMNAEVSASIDTSRVKKAVVTYRIVPNTPYRIHNYSMDLSDPKFRAGFGFSYLFRRLYFSDKRQCLV